MGECLSHPEGSHPVGQDAAWLRGFMMAVNKELLFSME